MKVLVTGAFGFFGIPLLRRLVGEGCEVVAWGHSPRSPAAMAAVPADVKIVEGDVVDGPFPPHFDLDAIVHLAGGGGPKEAAARPILAVRTGVIGTQRIVDLGGICGGVRRTIFASSIYVYPPHEGLCTEWTPTAPETLYGAIKEAGEAMMKAAGGVILRFAHLYGPSPIRLDSVMDRFAQATAAGWPLLVHGRGTHPMDLLHIDDACEAVVATLHTERPPAIVNVGGEVATTLQLAQWCAAIGNGRIQTGEIEDGGDPRRWLDSSLAAKALHWTPKIPLREGVESFVRGIHP